MKIFSHTSMSPESSPTLTKMTIHSICAPHNTLLYFTFPLLFHYMAILWNRKGRVQVKSQHCPQDPQLLSVASLIGLDENATLKKPLYAWKLKLQILLVFPTAQTFNIHLGEGLCNGTRTILLRVYPHILEVIIISRDHHGQKAFILRITLKLSSRQYPFTIR